MEVLCSLQCDAVELEESFNLSVSVFISPTVQALAEVGESVARRFPNINPFGSLLDFRSFPNLCLAFAGNSQLTIRAALLPQNSQPGRLRSVDAIKRGKTELFSGHAAFKQLVFLTLPGLLVFHCATVLIVLSIRLGGYLG